MSRTIAVLSCAVAGLAAAGILLAVILPAMLVRVRVFEAAAIAGACVVLAAGLGARHTRRPSAPETEPHVSVVTRPGGARRAPKRHSAA